jgi:5-methylcytosine-specific restriction endonuclease McrA
MKRAPEVLVHTDRGPGQPTEEAEDMVDGEYRRLKQVCTIGECDRTAQARSLCNTHYSRWWKTGTAAEPAPFVPPPCTVEGCACAATRKGLCGKHYARARYVPKPRILTPNNAKRRMRRSGLPVEPAICQVAACDKHARRQGYCAAHWHRLRAFGDACAAPPCTYCGEPISLDSGSLRHCSDRCIKRDKAGLPDKIPCAECGEMFRVVDGRKTCSDACSQARYDGLLSNYIEQQKRNPEYHARRRMVQQRRRVRLRKGEVEEFSFDEIAARDRWKCQLCGAKVDSALRHPDPLSGSIDHILPVSAGGSHTRTNVQLAHLRCNIRKSDRPVGQLLLIG